MSSSCLPENNQATPGEGFNSESKRRWTAPSPLPVPRPPAGSLGSRADSGSQGRAGAVLQGLPTSTRRHPRGSFPRCCVCELGPSISLSRPLGPSIRPAVTSLIRAALGLEGCDPEGHGQGGSDDGRRFPRTSGAGRPRSRCGWPSTSCVLAGPSLCTSASGPPEGDPVTEDCHPYDRLLPCPQIQPHSKVPGPRTPPCKYWGARFGRKRRLSSPAPPSSHRVCCLPGP